MRLQTFPAFCNTYVPEGLAQDTFCTSQNWVYAYTTQSSSNPCSNTTHPDAAPLWLPQHLCYCPAVFFYHLNWVPFHSHNETFTSHFKKVVISTSLKLQVCNWATWNCVRQEVPVHFNRPQNLWMVKRKHESVTQTCISWYWLTRLYIKIMPNYHDLIQRHKVKVRNVQEDSCFKGSVNCKFSSEELQPRTCRSLPAQDSSYGGRSLDPARIL